MVDHLFGLLTDKSLKHRSHTNIAQLGAAPYLRQRAQRKGHLFTWVKAGVILDRMRPLGLRLWQANGYLDDFHLEARMRASAQAQHLLESLQLKLHVSTAPPPNRPDLRYNMNNAGEWSAWNV